MVLEVHVNYQYICLKNDTTQLYFILGTVDLHFNFSRVFRVVSDIHRFPTVHMVKTNFLLKNRWISETSLGILEKIKLSQSYQADSIVNTSQLYIILGIWYGTVCMVL